MKCKIRLRSTYRHKVHHISYSLQITKPFNRSPRPSTYHPYGLPQPSPHLVSYEHSQQLSISHLFPSQQLFLTTISKFSCCYFPGTITNLPSHIVPATITRNDNFRYFSFSTTISKFLSPTTITTFDTSPSPQPSATFHPCPFPQP